MEAVTVLEAATTTKQTTMAIIHSAPTQATLLRRDLHMRIQLSHQPTSCNLEGQLPRVL